VNNGKLGPKDIQCFLVMHMSQKRYRLWYPKSNKIIQSRDVTFAEVTMLSSRTEAVVSSIDTGD